MAVKVFILAVVALLAVLVMVALLQRRAVAVAVLWVLVQQVAHLLAVQVTELREPLAQ